MKKTIKNKKAPLYRQALKLNLLMLEEDLLRLSVSRYPFITESVRHLLSAGGKRVRPIVMLLSAGAAGMSDIRKIRELAAGIEMLHTATLIHDDVMDRSSYRRGKSTLHELHGNKTAILVGDFLYARAMQIFVDYGNIDILESISQATTKVCEGETYQSLRQGDMQLDENSYLEIITNKTAALIESAGAIGAIAAGGSYIIVDALKQYALKTGIIFQIADDMIDIWSNGKLTGKDEANDIISGNLTLPLIHLLNSVKDHTKEDILNLITTNSRDINKLKKILKKYHSSDYCRNLIYEYHSEAIRVLKPLPSSNYLEALKTLSYDLSGRKT